MNYFELKTKKVILKVREVSLPYPDVISTPNRAYHILMSLWEKEELPQDQEVMVALFLTPDLKLSGYTVLNIGKESVSYVDIKALIRRALMCQCSKVIIAHNHPAGNTWPSFADLRITKIIAHALALVDIDLEDHLIISNSDYRSLRKDFKEYFEIDFKPLFGI